MDCHGRAVARAGAALLLLPGVAATGQANSSDALANNLPQRTLPTHPCSRPVSRLVRQALSHEILHVGTRTFKSKKQNWPEDCPWTPSKDLYILQEERKHREKLSPMEKGRKTPKSLYTCGFCGRKFISEYYMDLHMERKHMDHVPKDGVCLADFCEIFHVCQPVPRLMRGLVHQTAARFGLGPALDYVKSSRSSSSSSNGSARGGTAVADSLNHSTAPCDDAKLAVAKELCTDTLRKCFPLDMQATRHLYAQWSKQICHVLDCRIQAEHRSQESSSLSPLVLVFLLVLLLGGAFFGVMVFSVEYSDLLLQALSAFGLASASCVRCMLQGRRVVRTKVGFEDTCAA